MPTFDASLMSGPLLLAICMLAAFVATTVLVMALTTPHVTPAQRLARYARYTGRRGSPGAEAEMLTLRERIIAPLFQKVIELAARMAPSRARRTAAADLQMAGSRMNPTMFLGLQTVVMFGLPAFTVLYVLAHGQLGILDVLMLALGLLWGRRLPTMWLKRRIRSRQRTIDRSLPYSLDLMVACLEGGLS